MRRATDAERERLHDTFATLCRIDSPSGHERACANWVSAELRRIGLDVDEDGAGPAAGSDAGNLLSRIDGTDDRSIALCAHLDTVPLAAPVDPVLVNGGWENANDGILGADNKAAVAVMLELARRLKGAPQPPAVGIELVFTVCEEVSLRGSREFDTAGFAAASATCSTTPRRSARSCSPRPRTTGYSPNCTGAPCTPASAPKTDAARSPPRHQRSRRCGWAVSTPRRPRTSARSPAAAPSTWCPIAARSRPRLAASTPPARRSSRPRWSITSRTPPMPTNATST